MFTNHLHLDYDAALRDYDIFPKVIPAGKVSEITIKPLGRHASFKQAAYQLSVHPWDEGQSSQYPDRPNNFVYEVTPGEDGCIRFSFEFFGEQQYFIRLRHEDVKLQFSVYSVFDDLVGRYPFRGDLHMHSCRSDGRQSPEIVAANYRQTGYDFMAITDHHRYAPSLDAIAAYKDVPLELCLVPGEEVHVPSDDEEGEAWEHLNNVHIVSFGGDYSINALIDDGEKDDCDYASERRAIVPDPPPVRSKEQHWDEIDAYLKTLDIPEKVKGRERYLIASCRWVFEEIKKANGLGIFCHPYWLNNVISIPPDLLVYIMESKMFDAFEVLGGESYFEQNGYQTAMYFEDRARGVRYPVVGNTDSHNSISAVNRNSRVCSTIVFSRENERRELIGSIKDFYSVAVDTIDETPRFVGEFRLVRYACFLLKNFFPLHDELCFEEGRAMKDYACGVPGAKETLEFISGRMKAQREKYFGW